MSDGRADRHKTVSDPALTFTKPAQFSVPLSMIPKGLFDKLWICPRATIRTADVPLRMDPARRNSPVSKL